MTPEEFAAWRKAMSFTKTKAAEALGVGDSIVQYWEAGVRRDGKPAPIPHTVALACSALFHRLGPWSPPPENNANP